MDDPQDKGFTFFKHRACQRELKNGIWSSNGSYTGFFNEIWIFKEKLHSSK